MRLASTYGELRLFRRIALGEICMRLQRLMFLAAESSHSCGENAHLGRYSRAMRKVVSQDAENN